MLSSACEIYVKKGTQQTNPDNRKRIRFLGPAEVDLLLSLDAEVGRAALIGKAIVLG